jgi:hypothetical protein
MNDHTSFLYYEDHTGIIMATPANAIVNVKQNGTDVDIILTHGHNSTVDNTTVAEFLTNTRKIRV